MNASCGQCIRLVYFQYLNVLVTRSPQISIKFSTNLIVCDNISKTSGRTLHVSESNASVGKWNTELMQFIQVPFETGNLSWLPCP